MACELLSGRVALINSNIKEISSFFAKDNCREYINGYVKDTAKGLRQSKSKSSNTALFRFADKVFNNIDIHFEEDNCFLQLYLFTNYGAKPELQLVPLPSSVWSFYRFVTKGRYIDSWNSFVSRHYYIEKAVRKESNSYEIEEGKQKRIVQEEEFKYWDNTIYRYLLNGKSILTYILQYARNNYFDFSIVKQYTKNILKMKKETVNKIKTMADFIIETNVDSDIKKIITKLDSIDSSYLLRRFILNDVVKPYYEKGKKDAILTVKDYVDYLFPDINSWKETRDVLLIAIYEILHQQRNN